MDRSEQQLELLRQAELARPGRLPDASAPEPASTGLAAGVEDFWPDWWNMDAEFLGMGSTGD